MRKMGAIFLLAINVFAFYIGYSDKRLAHSGAYGSQSDKERRTAEVQLVALGAFGGTPGLYASLLVFNHKTSAEKAYLRRALSALALQNVVLVALFLKAFPRKSTF